MRISWLSGGLLWPPVGSQIESCPQHGSRFKIKPRLDSKGSGYGDPLLLGCDGSPGIWWVLQQQNGSVPFQVDDAMLMFDKTTNRHRGECGPLPLSRRGWGPVVSQGATGHSCPFISPLDILSLRICILSRAWSYRRLLSRCFLC